MTTPHDDQQAANAPGDRDHAGEPGDAAAQDRFENPGLPPHVPRRADLDPKAARRAEVQVVTLFTISALASILFVVAYYAIDPQLKGYVLGIGEMNLFHAALGVTMGLSLLCLSLIHI